MIHLGSIGGTSIDVDFSFIFVVALWVMNEYQESKDLKVALLWAPILFIGILVHEFAHAAMIGIFGYGPSSIILRGIGGVTINGRHARPWHDLVISLAGPVSSFIQAGIALLLYSRVPQIQRDPMMHAFIPLFSTINVLWGMFNLLPVSPLDGGHAVRNFLRMFLKEATAFVIAVWIAFVAGGAFIAFMLFSRDFLIAALVAWFVWMNFQQWQYFRNHGYPGD
jgi:Zn-dependent protease